MITIVAVGMDWPTWGPCGDWLMVFSAALTAPFFPPPMSLEGAEPWVQCILDVTADPDPTGRAVIWA